MTGGRLLLKEAVPFGFSAVYRDPILIIAFIIASILLWVAPWERLRQKKTEEREEDDDGVVRGRSVKSFARAQKRADARLKARRASLRSQRQPSGENRVNRPD
jgi:hypothetical protein